MEQATHKIRKERLTLNPIIKGLKQGIKSDGHKYSVRDDRRRYFFPNEWNIFIESMTNKKHRFFFITLVHTGARIMEALNLKYEDIDIERGTITFKVVKQRKAKKNYFATGKTRGFFVSDNYIKEFKSFIRNRNIDAKSYIFLDNDKLPKDYDTYSNEQRKRYYISKLISYSKMFKKKLKKIGIVDYYNFSPHNIRKTYGMWMRVYNLEMAEICYRMGHDIDTYIAHYGSSLIFTDAERREIQKIIGDVK